MAIECSVVIPLYNKQAEIRRCLESVLAQTMQDFEVIVVNDGSQDGGATLVEQFCESDRRIRLYNQSNQGVAAARNMGVSLAQGQCVAFLDADDEWLPEHLALLCLMRSKNPQAGVWLTAYWVDRGGGWRRRIRIPRRLLSRESALIADYFGLPQGKFLPSGSMMRKDELQVAGGYRKMFGEDVDVWMRMAARHPVAYCPVPTAVWHVDAGNRRCVQQGQSANLYNPGSLGASLVQILSDFTISSEVKKRAADYVAKRERKAIVATLLVGHRAHALYLYGLWRAQFRRRSLMIESVLGIPAAMVCLVGGARRQMRSICSLAAYIWDLPVSFVTFQNR